MTEEEKTLEEVEALLIKFNNDTVTSQDIAKANELLDFYREDE